MFTPTERTILCHASSKGRSCTEVCVEEQFSFHLSAAIKHQQNTEKLNKVGSQYSLLAICKLVPLMLNQQHREGQSEEEKTREGGRARG